MTMTATTTVDDLPAVAVPQAMPAGCASRLSTSKLPSGSESCFAQGFAGTSSAKEVQGGCCPRFPSSPWRASIPRPWVKHEIPRPPGPRDDTREWRRVWMTSEHHSRSLITSPLPLCRELYRRRKAKVAPLHRRGGPAVAGPGWVSRNPSLCREIG